MLRREHGFTIIEVLIIVVVIAILAAIVISQLPGISEFVKTNKVLSSFNEAVSIKEIQSLPYDNININRLIINLAYHNDMMEFPKGSGRYHVDHKNIGLIVFVVEEGKPPTIEKPTYTKTESVDFQKILSESSITISHPDYEDIEIPLNNVKLELKETPDQE